MLQEYPSESPRGGRQKSCTDEMPCTHRLSEGYPTKATRTAEGCVAASVAEAAGHGTTPSNGPLVGPKDGKIERRTELLGEARRRESCSEPCEELLVSSHHQAGV